MKFHFALLLLLARSCAWALDFGAPVRETPYDSFLSPVQETLQACGEEKPSLERVAELVRKAHAFRYSFSEPYAPQEPAVTEARQAGDCKDKALWLCHEMGDRSVRFVVGKAIRGSAKNHAWLLWMDGGRWWILDPTLGSAPLAVENVAPNQYLPLFSYTAGFRYAHGSLSSGSPAIGASARR